MQKQLHKPLISNYEIPTLSTQYFSPVAHKPHLPIELAPIEQFDSQQSQLKDYFSTNSDVDYFETPNLCQSTLDDSEILKQHGVRRNKFLREDGVGLCHSSSRSLEKLAQSYQSLNISISTEHYSKPAPRTPYESENSDVENVELTDRIEVTLTPISNFTPNKISDSAYVIKPKITGLARKLVQLKRIERIRKTIKTMAKKEKEQNTAQKTFYIKSALKKKTKSNQLPSRKQSIRWKQPGSQCRRFSCVARVEKRAFYSEVRDASDIIMNNNVMDFGPVFLEDYN